MDELAHQQRPNEGLRELALFAGAGGGILGGKLLGWRTVCAVEFEPSAAAVLIRRQNDGLLEPFPVWDDVCTFDGKSWKGSIDVVSGGFPCQDISAAGKGKGLEGERSGLWAEMFRIVCEVRPLYVLIENSPMLTIRGGARVVADLASVGFDARWGVLGGGHLGYPIKRDRMWILGINNQVDFNGTIEIHKRADLKKYFRRTKPQGHISDVDPSWLISNGYAVREFDGVAGELDRMAAIGNGQIPGVAAAAWRILA